MDVDIDLDNSRYVAISTNSGSFNGSYNYRVHLKGFQASFGSI